MKQRSPTLEGFRAVFRQPSFALAEIAWRWSVGFAAVSLFSIATLEYLRTLPVTGGDLFLLGTRQPTLIYQAIQHIFRGSASRVIWSGAVLAAMLTVAWVVIGALGRAATVRAILNYFRTGPGLTRFSGTTVDEMPISFSSLMGLNFFRAGAGLASLVGCVGAIILAGFASTRNNPAPGSVMLIFFMLVMFIGLAWVMVNWLLSLAAIFVVCDGKDSLGAIASAFDLWRAETGSVFAAGTWFGLAHLAAFILATSAVAFPLAFARILPAGVVIGGVLVVTLLYFGTVDFLYTGRLAAYIAILELPDAPPPVAAALTSAPFSQSVDREELILSDIPEQPGLLET